MATLVKEDLHHETLLAKEDGMQHEQEEDIKEVMLLKKMDNLSNIKV